MDQCNSMEYACKKSSLCLCVFCVPRASTKIKDFHPCFEFKLNQIRHNLYKATEEEEEEKNETTTPESYNVINEMVSLWLQS